MATRGACSTLKHPETMRHEERVTPTRESRGMQTMGAELSEAAVRHGQHPSTNYRPDRTTSQRWSSGQPPRWNAIPMNLKVMAKDLQNGAISMDLRKGKETHLQHIRLSDDELSRLQIGSCITFEDFIGILHRDQGAGATQQASEQPRAA